MQELELILASKLVERGRRGAVLTDMGEVFLPHAAACLAELESAVNSVMQIRERHEWSVRLGALPTVAAEIVPDVIRRFKREGATAMVQVVDGPNLHLLEMLRNDQLDLVIGRLAAPELMANLSFVHLYSEPVHFVVRRGHPLLEGPLRDPREITRFPIILPDRGAVIRPSVERLLISLGIGEIPNKVESVSTSFGRAFVLDTDAIWIISQGVVGRDLRSGELAALPIDTSDTSGPVGLTRRVDAPEKPGVDLLFRSVRQVAANR